MEKIVIDGENATMGRLASYSAKQALKGKEVIIVNSEKVVISGKKQGIINRYKNIIKKTSIRFSYEPEKILKRVIKGMLPKNARGREALKKIFCYKGTPEKFREEKKIKSGKEKENLVSLKEISERLK